jgi:predicted dehydrogenase
MTRVALIGLGAAARSIHVPACRQAGAVELIAGADPDANAQARFLELVRTARAFDDAETMIRVTRPDWVIIATPPASHHALCLSALAAGCHVFCEKPFVETAAQGKAILAAASAARRAVVVNHEFPRMDIFECAVTLQGTPRFGRPLFLQFWEHLWEHEIEGGSWRSQNLTMREFGTHVVDLAVRIYQAFPERIYARMASPGDVGGSDLVDVVTLDFPGGRLASVVLDRVCRGPHRYLDMRLDGEVASLRASFGGRAEASLRIDPQAKKLGWSLDLAGGGQAWLERDGKRTVVARNSLQPFADATARHFASAIEAVNGGREPAVGAKHALAIVRVVAAAYESAKSGQPVLLGQDEG